MIVGLRHPQDSFNLFCTCIINLGGRALIFSQFQNPNSQLFAPTRDPTHPPQSLHSRKSLLNLDPVIFLSSPPHTPHQTNRGDFGLRISLDARFEPLHSGFKATPLFEDMLRDNWLANRMTSLGVYWLSSDRDIFKIKFKKSLLCLKLLMSDIILKEWEYLLRFYPSPLYN